MTECKINIMGAMGVSKSTMTKAIHHKYGIPMFEEEFETNPYWRDTYQNKKPDALKMQYSFFDQYLRNSEAMEMTPRFVSDNHLFAGLAFSRTQYEFGMMDERDFIAYQRFFYAMIKHTYNRNMYHVILDKPTKMILEQVADRGRPEEADTQESFIESLRHSWQMVADEFNIRILDCSSLKKGEIHPVLVDYCTRRLTPAHETNIGGLIKLSK